MYNVQRVEHNEKEFDYHFLSLCSYCVVAGQDLIWGMNMEKQTTQTSWILMVDPSPSDNTKKRNAGRDRWEMSSHVFFLWYTTTTDSYHTIRHSFHHLSSCNMMNWERKSEGRNTNQRNEKISVRYAELNKSDRSWVVVVVDGPFPFDVVNVFVEESWTADGMVKDGDMERLLGGSEANSGCWLKTEAGDDIWEDNPEEKRESPPGLWSSGCLKGLLDTWNGFPVVDEFHNDRRGGNEPFVEVEDDEGGMVNDWLGLRIGGFRDEQSRGNVKDGVRVVLDLESVEDGCACGVPNEFGKCPLWYFFVLLTILGFDVMEVSCNSSSNISCFSSILSILLERTSILSSIILSVEVRKVRSSICWWWVCSIWWFCCWFCVDEDELMTSALLLLLLTMVWSWLIVGVDGLVLDWFVVTSSAGVVIFGVSGVFWWIPLIWTVVPLIMDAAVVIVWLWLLWSLVWCSCAFVLLYETVLVCSLWQTSNACPIALTTFIASVLFWVLKTTHLKLFPSRPMKEKMFMSRESWET